MNKYNSQILHLALPAIATNITVPLLGLVDTIITGHLGCTAYIGAVSVGATLFNMLYWNFGFLRMGTSGLTAQAFGRRSFPDMANILFRALFFAVVFSLCIAVLQYPLVALAFKWMQPSAAVEYFARQYFSICLWGAPAILGMYCFNGWFIGMQNTRFPMVVAIANNVVNILASLLFVFVGHMGVRGVALGTLLSQYFGLCFSVILWLSFYSRFLSHFSTKKIFLRSQLSAFFKLNGSIFFRTFCLIAVMSFYTFSSAHYGDVLLAVNVLLLQLFNIFSYFTDGFAYAGEALSGRYIGAGDRSSFLKSVRLLFLWGGALVGAFSFVYYFFADYIFTFMTNDVAVLSAVQQYYFWVLLVPLAGFAAFLWDGVMVGATTIKPMVLASSLSAAAFFMLYFTLPSFWGNHLLWFSFIAYLFLRSGVQTVWAQGHWKVFRLNPLF